MKISVLKETFSGERRVALVPASIAPLQKIGCQVTIQQDAGAAAGYLDQEYIEKGAQICADRTSLFDADIVLGVRGLGANQQAGAAD
ncbi:MAG: hypothetical protein KDA87_20010, partial [Planctomycetales bacterium]|nr:hypothetical protein [Planctomycetales bacterium]